MGSAFRLPIWKAADYAEVLEWCAAGGIKTVGTDAEGTRLFSDINWRQPCALIVGPESEGLSSEELAAVNESVRIPMQGDVESLNVAVATGVLLYEAARQRGAG